MLDGGDMGLMVCGKMISTEEAGFAISVTSRLLFHSFTDTHQQQKWDNFERIQMVVFGPLAVLSMPVCYWLASSQLQKHSMGIRIQLHWEYNK